MKTFKDYLQEISLKTKANAYKKMKQTARETDIRHHDDPYEGPSDDEVKFANKRAGNMRKAIRKSHPKGKDVVKGIDKKTSSGGYDYDRDRTKDPLVNKQKRLDDLDKTFGRKTTKSGRYTKQTQTDLKRRVHHGPRSSNYLAPDWSR